MSNSGGAAMSGGSGYQDRVAAWLSVLCLSEKAAEPSLGLASSDTIERVSCEQPQPVDDVLAVTSAEGGLFFQCKRTISLSDIERSEFDKTIAQFMNQFLSTRNCSGTKLGDRPLEPARDRLVLATTRESSGKIKDDLPRVLRRLSSPDPEVLPQLIHTNDDEEDVVGKLRTCAVRAWTASTGSAPSEPDLVAFLSLVRVEVLDLDDGQVDQQASLNLLRTGVLRNPDQASLAWDHLFRLCHNLAERRTSRDRQELINSLIEAGIDLRGVRSYWDDIARLQEYSRDTLANRRRFAEIRLSSSERLKIERPVVEVLVSSVAGGSVLVTGDPGSGKSGVLCDFHERLCLTGDSVYIAIDLFEIVNQSSITAELRIEHRLEEILANWPGVRSAVLIIDAMDAARSPAAQTTIRRLIESVMRRAPRWKVVASMRKFDLHHASDDLRALFPLAGESTDSSSFADPGFADIRHVNVPVLSEQELASASGQFPPLAELLTAADIHLNQLLREVFNLRLAVELLSRGATPAEVSPARTQVQLLDRFWKLRVTDPPDVRDQHERVLSKAATAMIGSKSLVCKRTEISAEPGFFELIRRNVLMEAVSRGAIIGDSTNVAFSHNILFDYAVARLILSDAPPSLGAKLSREVDLVIAVRPSLGLYFQRLWWAAANRSLFWEAVLSLESSSGVPEVAKVIGPGVAVEHGFAANVMELEPLLRELQANGRVDQSAAEKALQHLVGALMVGLESREMCAPWYEFTDRLAWFVRPSTSHLILILLRLACRHAQVWTPSQLAHVGTASRRLLEFAWAQPNRNRDLVRAAIQYVCVSAHSDSESAQQLLRRSLQQPHLGNHGYEEMSVIAHHVPQLVRHAPDFVAEVYSAVFGFVETSTAPVPLGNSRLLQLTSNRRDGYQGARWQLGRHFDGFLQTAPAQALRSAVQAAADYAAQQQTHRTSGPDVVAFQLNGLDCSFQDDLSGIWDSRELDPGPESITMLHAAGEFLEELATNGDARFHSLFEEFLSAARTALVWRTVLRIGISQPEAIGLRIWQLAATPAVLISTDTKHLAGEFMGVIHPLLEARDKAAIEEAVAQLPENSSADRTEFLERHRARLLGCIGTENLVTENARQALSTWLSSNELPDNRRPFAITSYHEPYSDERYLAEQGVPVEAPPNRRIRDLEAPVSEFAQTQANRFPSAEEVEAVMPHLRLLGEALDSWERDGVAAKQYELSLDRQLAAIGRALVCKEVTATSPLIPLSLSAIRAGEIHANPVFGPGVEESLDSRWLTWDSPSPRIAAAKALMRLASISGVYTPEVRGLIQRLAQDPVPAVRYQIASRLSALLHSDRDLMWDLMERYSHHEQSGGVLIGLIKALDHIAPVASEIDRVVGLIDGINRRELRAASLAPVRSRCVQLLADCHIWRGHARCAVLVSQLLGEISSQPRIARNMLSCLRVPVVYEEELPDTRASQIRARAIDLYSRLFDATLQAFRMATTNPASAPGSGSEEEHAEPTGAQALFEVLAGIPQELFFASGGPHDDQAPGAAITPAPAAVRLFQELRASGILERIPQCEFAAVVHHLIEFIEQFTGEDPDWIFATIAQAVRSGSRDAYQFESQAAAMLVPIVESYLANHRQVFQNRERSRELVELLNTFVGWPSAHRLVYRLEEVFR